MVPGGLVPLAILCFFSFTSAWAAVTSEMKLGVGQSSYMSSNQTYFREGAQSKISSLTGSIDLEWSEGQRDVKVDVSSVHRQNDGTYVHPREFYVQYQLSDAHRLTFGRQRHTWSEADVEWQQGLWQPRFTDDKLRQEHAGFTGAFYQYQNQSWAWTAFASPLFIPDMGAYFEVNDHGLLESSNPWFRPPTTHVMFQGQKLPVRYSIEMPSVAEAALRWNGALQVARRKGSSVQRLSYAYKPMNQVLVGFPYKLKTFEDDEYVLIRPNPRFLYHHVVSGEWAQKVEGGWHSLASLSYEQPVRDRTPEDWVTQEVTPAVITSGYLGKDIIGSGPAATHIGIGFYHVSGGDAPDAGEMAMEETFFERRYEYTRAVKMKLRHALGFLGKWPVLASSELLYDFAQRAAVFSTQLDMTMKRKWTLHLRADFLGMVDERPADVKDGFIRRHRANDRFLAEVSYVF